MGSLYHKHEVLSFESRICVVMCLHRLEQWILATIISQIKKTQMADIKERKRRGDYLGMGKGLGCQMAQSSTGGCLKKIIQQIMLANYKKKIAKYCPFVPS